ncbi:6-phosphogluconolactonase [Methylomagnum ishizawai]|uniref:6-phosphogluconolactonase n=1 Tax=Methylomagnum ishizawai TaxID=1760988 RepID=UPI001C7F5428|nr:6-phosphogluconolactonase [Methylomagnum ishizawai]
MPSLYISDNLDAIASEVARMIVSIIGDVLSTKPYCIWVPSAGRTLIATWAKLRELYSGAVDWQRVVCVQMDEYYGVPPANPTSFAWQLDNELIKPLGIKRLITFLNADGELKLTPQNYERQLYGLGGIDCAVHGVGRNAHIGFNEPSPHASLNATRIVALSTDTRAANQVEYTHGITLGLDALTSARHSLVVIVGMEKRFATESLLTLPNTPANPVSYLRARQNTSAFIDSSTISATILEHIRANRLPSGFCLH